MVSTADDAGTLLEYMLGERDRQGRLREVRRLGGPAGLSFDGVVGLLEAHARLRPSLSRHVGHGVLRLAPQDRRLGPDEWREAASYLAGIAFGADAWTAVQHDDTHVHVLWSRVRRDGTTVCHSHDRRRAEAAARHLEQQFGLTQIPSSWQLDPRRSPVPTRSKAPEAPVETTRRAAVWAAWKACRTNGTLFRAELADREVPLCLNEEATFCIDLGDGRRIPLVRVLADCSREAGSHVPREREVLAGLKGLGLSTMDQAWLAASPASDVEAVEPMSAGEVPVAAAEDYDFQEGSEEDLPEEGEKPANGSSPAPATPMPDEGLPAEVATPASEVPWVANPEFAAWSNERMRRSDVRDAEAAILQSAQAHLALLSKAGPVRALSRWVVKAWTGKDPLKCARTAVALAAGRQISAQRALDQLRDVRRYERIQEPTMPASLMPVLADPSPEDLVGRDMLLGIGRGSEKPDSSSRSLPNRRPVGASAPKVAPRRESTAPRSRPRPTLE